MMDHIIDHSVMVSNVAVCIGGELKKTSPLLNLDLVKKAALLHDITKTRSFTTGEIHSETGAGLLSNLGYPEIGDIIRQHVILDDDILSNTVTEPEIVNYADKRVLHDRVVSLDKRLAYIQEKYGYLPDFNQRVKVMWDKTILLERKLFKGLPFTPNELKDQVEQVIEKLN